MISGVLGRRLLVSFSALALCVIFPVVHPLQAGDPTVEALLDAGHFKRARAILEPRLRSNPNDGLTAFLLSRVKLAYDDAQGSIALAEKSIAAEPNNADYHTHLAHIYGWLSGEPPAIKQIGYVRLLKKELEAALTLNPKQLDAMLIKAVFLAVAPSLVGGDKKQSDALVQQMVQMNREKGYLTMGQVGERVKSWGRSEEGFKKTLEVNPRNYTAQYELGMLYCYWNPARHCDATVEKLGKELVQEAPSRIGGYTLLAEFYAAQQRWADLDAAIAQAEKAVPDDLSPYFYAAQQLQWTGSDLPRAEQYLHKYMSQEREGDAPNMAMAHTTLGLALNMAGRKPEAVTELQAALRQQPNYELARKELKRIQ